MDNPATDRAPVRPRDPVPYGSRLTIHELDDATYAESELWLPPAKGDGILRGIVLAVGLEPNVAGLPALEPGTTLWFDPQYGAPIRQRSADGSERIVWVVDNAGVLAVEGDS